MSNAYLAKSMPDSSDQPQPPLSSEQALAREERKEHTSMLLLLTPALVIVVVLLIMPLCWLALQSVQTEEGFSLANYVRIFQETIYWDTFALTFKISFMVTILSVVMGFPIAYAASRLQGLWANLILICVILPFWTSVLVRAYAWLVLLQRRGLVNQTLMDLGIIDQPLTLMHNTTGTVIGTLHVMLPFMVLPLYSVMKKIPQDLMQASESLGAKPFYTFRRVFLPMAAPGIMAGSILVFVICLGFFITPELLGGGRTILVSMLVQRNVELYHAWGAASAVGLVLLFVVFLIFWGINRFIPIERILGAR
ncbi:ABC transporter permease [Pseudomonas fluorescens]|jgi:putative spermidine/putrescine transport system permease protein|uniref:Putrescine transport system permease protein PotH n=3 Tax=Pseudomonas TaxID=286 RepID=A0A5M9J0L0_9PSED|nr:MULTISPECIES: ABC transporter permease [Pseudomonas]AHC34850.1 ABC transporter permease [Pseudomonas sp. TKP]AOE68264.1 ABC transporter permease [Pseudomonas fluorescens]AOE74093.1 ABC transporter permease [Pseudomonas fluorescens]KAA8561953.1 Putrescine transport system permease protein PotH [Pseudomonas extremaustralis]MBL1311377.1 ABC transporter permease [Pseudomonas sp.]